MTIPQKPAEPETVEQTFTRWLSDGSTWIGVFENKDLCSCDLGRRVALAYGTEHLLDAKPNVSTAPDSPAIGLGWRYLLVAKCLTVSEALAAMDRKEV